MVIELSVLLICSQDMLQIIVKGLYTVTMYMCAHPLSQNGLSPLYVSSQEGHTEIVEILLKSGANPNLTTTVYGLVYSFYLLCVNNHLH